MGDSEALRLAFHSEVSDQPNRNQQSPGAVGDGHRASSNRKARRTLSRLESKPRVGTTLRYRFSR